VGDLLDKFFRDYMLTRLGLSQEAAERLYTRAKDDYGLKMPEDLAKRMVTNLCRGKQRQLMPRVQSEFFGQVHLYAQDTILRVGELTKKLHT
jgi:hypothetical protein